MALATSALSKDGGPFLAAKGQTELQNREEEARDGGNIYRPFPAVPINKAVHLPVAGL